METILGAILSYLISLAANLRTDAIFAHREKRLKAQLEREDAVLKALASVRPIREELRDACAELVRNRSHLGLAPREESLWPLLSDESFQADLTEWLMAGGIDEGAAVKGRLLDRLEAALAQAGATQEQIAFLKNEYFEALDKAVFAHPVLAQWRHHLSLNYLRQQVAAFGGGYGSLNWRTLQGPQRRGASKALFDRHPSESLEPGKPERNHFEPTRFQCRSPQSRRRGAQEIGQQRALPLVLAKLDDPDVRVRSAAAEAVGKLGDKETIPALLLKLDQSDPEVLTTVVEALWRLCGEEPVPQMLAKLDHPVVQVRRAVLRALIAARNNETDRILLSRDLDGVDPWVDPKEPITEKRLAAAAGRLGITHEEVRSLYASMADTFHLRFA